MSAGPNPRRAWLTGVIRFLPTLLLGIAGGGLAYVAGLPLPWLLGALIASTLVSLSGTRLRSPGRARRVVLVVIGVMLGTAFSPDMTGDVTAWGTSLIVMLAATALMMAFSMWFGRRVAGYSVSTALYAGVPGGVSAVTLMAVESNADLRIVGLTHAVRILVLLVAIPPVLSLLGHVTLQSQTVGWAHWLAVPGPGDSLMLAFAGLAGVWLGRWLRLPNPLLFGPVLVSAALHVSGMTEAGIPPMIVALAQVIIGLSVGVRFGGTPLREVGHGLMMAVVQAVALLAIAVGAAWGIHAATGISAAAALLAYMPGGAPELSLAALSLGIDPAFVTSHHLLRLSVLVLLLPWLLRGMSRLAQR
ncbi:MULTISPECIES: AbrB family transcriptional regulator [unclassified Modicisalibacter]|uniref:AbrB family transcriptional regulator n=1 Tax=unclassified Modicisalibacter TaxID=2679913 RepID=UPI001CCEE990|nr:MULTISPECIES: AbrB family transcriptional regulator [unclassified Modicisalibacter]MBZ9560098.1 AbrB family transcriptional regulator [Modicisalibacter sp. R2A 31.J]MBZ9576006.1 AbrB family transcriptional regulator [Modicisalibacter sp. MOD 31.J]